MMKWVAVGLVSLGSVKCTMLFREILETPFVPQVHVTTLCTTVVYIEAISPKLALIEGSICS